MTDDEQPPALVHHLSHILHCAACGFWSQNLNKIAEHCRIKPSVRCTLQDISHCDLHAIRQFRFTYHSLCNRCDSWQFDDRSSKVTTVLAGCNGNTTRTATHIEKVLKPFKVVGCGELSAGRECICM